MRFSRTLLSAALVWICLSCSLPAGTASSTPAQSSLTLPTVAWQRTLPHSVDWGVRTSWGVLIVRAGKSLTALDEQSGEPLWSIPELEIGGGGGMLRSSRGNNLLEVPGLPVLLLNRAKLPGKQKGELLGIQIWTGAIQWSQPELDDLLTVVPLYNQKRLLLVSKKINKTMKSAMLASQVASHFFWEAQIVNLYWSGPVPFRPVLTLLDPLTGKVDWTRQFPRQIKPEFFAFRFLGGRLFLQEVTEFAGTRLSAINTENGERLWQFKSGSGPLGSVPTPLQFAGGRVILAAREISALDPASGKPAWQARKLGDLFGMTSDGESVYATTRKQAMAMDAATGAVRWKVPVKPTPTNPVLVPEQKSIVICDKQEFLMIGTATGEVVRRTKTHVDQNPLALRREGKNYLLALNPLYSSLFDLSGERLSDEPLVEAVFPSVSFVVSQPLPVVGTQEAPRELLQQLQANWSWLKEVSTDQRNLAFLEQLQKFMDGGLDNRQMYAVNGDQTVPWHLWAIDPATGAKQEFPVKSSKVEAAPERGMIFEFQKETVRGLRAAGSPAEPKH